MPANRPLLEAKGICRRYRRRGSRRKAVQALNDVDLILEQGSTLALIGETGSGKSTLARCLALLERPDAGSIRFDNQDLLALGGRRLAQTRRQIQLIFQDPGSALNPRFTAAELVAEPLRIQGDGAVQSRSRALAAMEQVGLLETWADRRPAQFSGGQRQRLAIARALVLEPRMLILDEALSALDLSIQAQMVNLLIRLREAHDLTYLLISHDLRLAAHLADEIAVLRDGRLVERAATEKILHQPAHPYTQQLLTATPGLPTG